LIIEDIIRSIATAGGTRTAVNPVTEGLISAQASSEVGEHRVSELFDFVNSGKYFMSNAQQSQFVIVSLPSFLKLQVTAYTLGAPPLVENKKAHGGVSSWILEASDNPDAFQVVIDSRNDTRDLQGAGAVQTFSVSECPGFYRHFKLTQTGPNHQGNLSIFLSRFDFSGKLTIHRE
jgi:hypothetical protein